MDKQIITFSANEQHLHKTGGLDIFATKTVSYIEAHFDLGQNWSGYDSVEAVWWNDYVRPVRTVLDTEGICVVPTEVLLRKGAVYVNLVGVISSGNVLTDRLTTHPITALTNKFNAQLGEGTTTPLTPSEYEQFVATVKADADRAEDAKDSARVYAGNALSSAQNALISETNASASEDNAKASELNAETYKNQAQTYAQNAHNSAISAENAKDEAEDARDTILGMRAEATTLSEGSSATASYNDGVMSFGIPKGDTGARGATGETGATPQLSIGTVETTTEPSVTITGTAENPVLNFGLVKGDKGDTGDVSQAQLDAAVSDLKSEISDLEDIAVIDGATANLYNPLINLDSTMTIAGGQVYTRTLDTMQGAAVVPIKQGLYYQLIDFDAQGNASVTTNNWRIITNGGTLIRYADGQQPWAVNYQAEHSAETTAILQINLRTSAVKTMIVEFYYPQNSLYTPTYVPPVNAMNSCKDWNGKVWCTYGDSFVAQGNGDLLTNGWQKYVNDYMGFAKHYGRGIGGTSFLYGSKSYYLDGHGVYDTSYTSGTLVHGGFCAWDRITNQIPEKVRNDIELLFVLGGNNDYTNYYNPDNTSWKEWSASNTDDADWISYCTSHGLPVGDYQIGGNPKGAIMSMIMKLQVWCPNAIIVLCGGSPTRGSTSGQNMTAPTEITVANLTHNMRDVRDMVKDVADWCSIPYCDIYANMGVNFLNRNIYSDDTIHPNEAGRKMIARVVCGTLKTVLPKTIFG